MSELSRKNFSALHAIAATTAMATLSLYVAVAFDVIEEATVTVAEPSRTLKVVVDAVVEVAVTVALAFAVNPPIAATLEVTVTVALARRFLIQLTLAIEDVADTMVCKFSMP